MRRKLWLTALIGGTVLALFAGRWLAQWTTAMLWADALGVAEPHGAIAGLRLALEAAALVGASVWCIGNLLMVYRQIGSVQVPRRVGNLEIVETIPRAYLFAGAVGIGLILAFALSRGAGDWWVDRALVEASTVVGVRDPILDRDVGYYLFRLPWIRAAHGYVLLLVAVVLLLLILLYGAVGAIRWSERRLVCTDLARWHLGAVLAALALTLAWGYRLEPAELVAGLHDVPFDGVLTSVRIPAARLLTALAVLVAGTSLLWLWLGRHLLLAVAWGALAVGSFVGHYVAPPFVAAARGPERVAVADLATAQAELVRSAFGLAGDTVRLELAVPDAAFTTRHREDLIAAPVWDHFAVTHLLNRSARPAPPDPRSADGFVEASLGTYPDPAGRPVPLFLAVRQPDTARVRLIDPNASWERRHGEPYAHARGAVAIHAGAAATGGVPRYLPDIARPDSLVDRAVDLRLARPEVWFAPAMAGYALAAPDRGPIGIAAGATLRRLALVWTLQAPRLLTSEAVRPETVVLTDRAVDQRLARYAPFARFGAAYPAVVEDRLLWLSTGYVAGETYPLSFPVVWRGRTVRYLRAGFVGVVDAHTGATSVYLLPDADPLARAWAELVPAVVQPANRLPAAIRDRLRYPEELFTVQLGLLGRRRPGGLARTPEPFWWAGPSPADPDVRLRLRAVIEVQLEPRVAAVVEGIVVDGTPRLTVFDYPEPLSLPGPSELTRTFGRDVAEGAVVAGTLRLVPFGDGAVGIQAFYTDSGTLAEVAVGWRGAIGRAATVERAVAAVRPVARDDRPLTAVGALEAAREWFRRLDSARAAGDWRAFGEAWEGLRGVLGGARDTLP